MSLEQAISDHAAAIRELAAAMRDAGQPRGAAIRAVAADTIEADVAKVEADAKKPTTAKEAVKQAAEAAKAAGEIGTRPTHVVGFNEQAEAAVKASSAGTAKAPAADKAPPADTAKGEAEVTLSYDAHIKPALVKLLTKNKPAGLALFGEFGVANGQGLTPDQYPAVLERINELLAG